MVQNYKISEAVKLSATFKGKVEAYALAWLNLTNHAREYPATFKKVYNNSGNGVTVVTSKRSAEAVKDFLEGLSNDDFKVEVWGTEDVLTVAPIIYWDGDEFDGITLEELDTVEVIRPLEI